ncbi:MAG: hypothetical protein WCK10_01755 [Candidatus Staskawiczbacteria bacterium]
MKNGIILIGCGIHAQDNYLQFIKKYKYNLKLIVDTCEAEKNIIKNVNGLFRNPPDLYFVKTSKNVSRIKKEDRDWLTNYVKNNEIGHVIISTDPLSHKMYLEWAVDVGLNVLCEKPLTGYKDINNSIVLSRRLNSDFECLNRACCNKNIKVFIQAQRRYHPVYEFIYSAVKDIILSYGITINYIGIFSGNGIFNSIEEYITKENHPHNKGYGKLFHSGYHFADLFCWFADLNTLADNVKYTEISAFTNIYSVKDLNSQFERAHKKHSILSSDPLFETKNKENVFKLDGLGEVDLYTQVLLKSGESTILNGQLALLQNSTSRRVTANYNANTIKDSSAIRKELFIIELGPLYSISVSASQNHGVGLSESCDYNYVVTIHKNNKYIKGKAYEEVFFHNRTDSKNFKSFNKKARLECLQDFLNSGDGSDLGSHALSVNLFSLIQENIAKINSGKVGFSQNKLYK